MGFVRLFGVVGSFLVKPQFLKNLDEEFFAYRMEEDCISRRLVLNDRSTDFDSTKNVPQSRSISGAFSLSNFHKFVFFLCRRLQHAKATGKSYVSPVPMSPPNCNGSLDDEEELLSPNPGLMCLRNGALQRGLTQRLEEVQMRRKLLDEQRRTWWVRRTLLYPLAMLALLVLSTATALLAVQNTLELLIGIKALPLSTRVSRGFFNSN